VYRSPKIPKGPLLDNRRKRSNPSATVGTPIIALKNPLTNLLPVKDDRPITTAIGRPHMHDNNVAKAETMIDLTVIENTSGSPFKIRFSA
jgi:hypothetical protein